MADVFIASSWKQRTRVRDLAIKLRELDYTVYDFTDPKSRTIPEIPPEKFPRLFDPSTGETYWRYIHRKEWVEAMEENKKSIDECSLLVLLLPCGVDATADWAYAVGAGKETYIVGNPHEGERSPVHMWASGWFENDDGLLLFMEVCSGNK